MGVPLGAGRVVGVWKCSSPATQRMPMQTRVGPAVWTSRRRSGAVPGPMFLSTNFAGAQHRTGRRVAPCAQAGAPGEPDAQQAGSQAAGVGPGSAAEPTLAPAEPILAPGQQDTTSFASSSGSGASTAGQPPAPSAGAPGTYAASSVPPAAAAGVSTAEPSQPPDLGEALHGLATSALAAAAATLAWVKALPMWAQNQQLRRAREAADDEPQDADRHAVLLAELNRAGRYQEVLESVDGRQRNTASAAVTVQYLRALVASGRIAEYVPSTPLSSPMQTPPLSPVPMAVFSATSIPSTPAAAEPPTASAGTPLHLGTSAAPAPAPAMASVAPQPARTWTPPAGVSGSETGSGAVGEHRSLYQLLGDLQNQVAGEQPDLSPGVSSRRPLHVLVQGMGAVPAPRPLGPLQVLWTLLRTVMLIVAIAFAWLVGNQAIRRAQMQSQPAQQAVSSVMPAPNANGAGPAGTSVDPKEYKKEELPEKSIKNFSDVRGCDEAKEELREVVEFLKSPTKFTRLGAKLPKGVLLTGPPGTGKTLLARAVAGEAGVPFFYRAGSEFEELYVGVGARRMRALFQAAKRKAPCIVFIDEIDAIGGNRKHWENNTRKTLNQLLVEMDGFDSNDGVIVVAATNLAETLDPALKRPGRFDRQVAVPLPDIKGRIDILSYYMKDKPVEKEVDAELLARQTQGFSGADISNLINEAALLAAKENKDTISAAALEYAFDKISMGVERKSARRTAEGVKRTAFHEGGHAIVAMSTPGASPVHKATVVPRGHALGMVTQVGREDEFSINRQQMLARIRVCMGGTVAEELVFGPDQVSSGASDDLRQATEMARYMVTRCGMNDLVGPQYLAGGEDRGGNSPLSEETRNKVDGEVRRMLVEAKDEVKTLLTARMKDLHALAAALIDRETLSREEIEAIISPGASASGRGSATEIDPRAGSGQQGPDDDRDGEGDLVRSVADERNMQRLRLAEADPEDRERS